MFPFDLSDRSFERSIIACCILAGVIVICMVLFIAFQAWPSLVKIGPRFLFDENWAPTAGQFNALPMIVGSLASSVGSVLFAAPLAWTLASVQSFYLKGALFKTTELVIDLLAGIPSVVIGFWGLSALVPLLYELSPPGANLLAGILVLTVMVLPIMTVMFRKLLETTPKELLDASFALGLSRRTLIWKMLLPAKFKSILSIVLLSLGRAIGETIAVLMVIGNIPQLPDSLLAPVRTLTSNIALEMAYALDEHRSALFANALFLVGCVAILLALAKAATTSKLSRHV